MKIPKTLKIGGMNWTVIHHKEVSDQTRCFGRCDCNEQIIYLQPDMKPDNEARTFLHELLHALFWTANIGGFLDDQPRKDREEDIVSTLDSALLQVIRDNDLDFRS